VPAAESAQEETGAEGVEEFSADEGDDGAGGAKAWGFDIDRMNAEWAFVLMGSKAVVVREQTTGPIEDRVRVIGLEGFQAKFLNKPTQISGGDGKIKTVTWAYRWLRHTKRRSYDGIEFFPNPEGTAATRAI
jgi:hypothetical protein